MNRLLLESLALQNNFLRDFKIYMYDAFVPYTSYNRLLLVLSREFSRRSIEVNAALTKCLKKESIDLNIQLVFQVLFRKVEDVKREEELEKERQNQPPLELGSNHPVRKLFNKFKKSLVNVQDHCKHLISIFIVYLTKYCVDNQRSALLTRR